MVSAGRGRKDPEVQPTGTTTYSIFLEQVADSKFEFDTSGFRSLVFRRLHTLQI